MPHNLQSDLAVCFQMTKSDTVFADVGGLDAAKHAIRDILELPVKFARLYDNAPIRLPTGIILYGPPGSRHIDCDWRHPLL